MKNKAIVIGYYGNSNFGDDLLINSFIDKITSNYEKITVINSGENAVTFDYNNIKNVSIWKVNRKVLSKFNFILMLLSYTYHSIGSKDIFFAGGTQLFETKKNKYINLLVYFLFSMFSKLSRKRIYHFGVGVNPAITKIGSFLLKNVLKMADRIIVRDTKSYLVSMDMVNAKNNGKVFECADLAYLNFDNLNSSLINCGSINKKVGVNLFPYFDVVESSSKDSFTIQVILKIIDGIATKEKIDIYLIGSQNDHPLSDSEYMSKFSAQLEARYKCNVVECPYDNDSKEFAYKIAQFDYIISMRLHIIITAAIFGNAKIYGLAYQEKVKSECESLMIPFYDYNSIPEELSLKYPSRKVVQKKYSDLLRLFSDDN
tara:strand:+ start:2475 stop:3590 length:1116 start_codon:yes stop_codon:yes gene_type:complete